MIIKAAHQAEPPRCVEKAPETHLTSVNGGYVETTQSQMPPTEEKMPSVILHRMSDKDSTSDIHVRPAEEILGMKRIAQSANPTKRDRQAPIFTKEERTTLDSRTGRINSQIFEDPKNLVHDIDYSNHQKSMLEMRPPSSEAFVRPPTSQSLERSKPRAPTPTIQYHNENIQAMQFNNLMVTVSELKQQVELL